MEILRGSASFKYGMSNPDQLITWLQDNETASGVSFVGRSNVGKSSMINALFGKSVARTSNTPGRTREINIFSFKLTDGKFEHPSDFWLFDLPGYGHAQVSKDMSRKWDILMNEFFTYCPGSIQMVNIQDARHPNQEADQRFQQYLKPFDFTTTLVFNKMDKLKKQKERAALNKMKPELFAAYKWVKDIHFTSADKGDGLKGLHDSIVTHVLQNISEI